MVHLRTQAEENDKLLKMFYLFVCHCHLIHHHVSSLQYGSFQWFQLTFCVLWWVPWQQAFYNISLADMMLWLVSREYYKRKKSDSVPHFKREISAEALDTRNTKAGLTLLPPAPKICSAADIKTGFSAPTIWKMISFRYRITGGMLKSKFSQYAIWTFTWYWSN